MPTEAGIQFGERIQTILVKNDTTCRAIAELTGVTPATIGRWSRGEVPNCIDVLAGLREHFGTDLNELICPQKPNSTDLNELQY